MSSDMLQARIRSARLARDQNSNQRKQAGPDELEIGPASVYEAVTRTMVEGLAEDVREIRNRINGIFWLLAGTVAADIMMKALGVGS